MTGPDKARVTVLPDDDYGYAVATTTNGGLSRRNRALDLGAALRLAAKGVKALVKIEEQEAEVRKAREEAMAALGEPEAETVAQEDDTAVAHPMVEDQRPHSRACGVQPHDHGAACHANCPTCHGKGPEDKLHKPAARAKTGAKR